VSDRYISIDARYQFLISYIYKTSNIYLKMRSPESIKDAA